VPTLQTTDKKGFYFSSKHHEHITVKNPDT